MAVETKLNIKDRDGKRVGELPLSDEIVDFTPHAAAMRDCVVAYRNNQRAFSASTKTRSQVKASGAKPWRQKGTGRARAGTLASPLFRGGGVIFGPHPKKVRTNLPKKVRKLALKSALAQKLRDNKAAVIDKLEFSEIKTKTAAGILKSLGIDGSVLLLVDKKDDNLCLSFRNIKNVAVRTAENTNAYDVLSHKYLIMTEKSAQLLGLGK